MTRERFEELLNFGPRITREDYDRLLKFVPKLTPIALAVRQAFSKP